MNSVKDVMINIKNVKVLDVCCGSRMFWFDKKNPITIFNDVRNESHTLCDGRELEITPDTQYDFRNLPFESNTFKVVIFDPPHLEKLGKNSWMAKKYGVLAPSWKHDISAGFNECFRVLDVDGVLIFKWNQNQITTNEILKLSPYPPLIGHKSGKSMNTHWVCFIKPSS